MIRNLGERGHGADLARRRLVARIPFSSSTPLKSTNTFGFLMRSFSQSKLSMPPAITHASSPCCCSKLLRIRGRVWLKQVKSRHYISYDRHVSLLLQPD